MCFDILWKCFFSKTRKLTCKEEEELIEATHLVYLKVKNDFQECSRLLSRNNSDKESKETVLLKLDTSINESLIKFKNLQKSFPKEKSALFSRTMDDLFQGLSQWKIDFCQGALSEPFEKFKFVLKSEADITMDELQIKIHNKPFPRKEIQTKEAQQLLNTIKDTYDRNIAAFNSCIKSSQTRSLDFQDQVEHLNLVIDTSSLQFRTVVEKFSQASFQYVSITFERMRQDFSNFKNAMPPRERTTLDQYILKFERAISLNQSM